jgi:hypothetical protein
VKSSHPPRVAAQPPVTAAAPVSKAPFKKSRLFAPTKTLLSISIYPFLTCLLISQA